MRRRRWIVAALVIVVVCAALCATALLAWPRVDLDPADVALAHIALPHFAGRVTAAMVSLPTGEPVPVQLRNGDLWPQGKLAAGERADGPANGAAPELGGLAGRSYTAPQLRARRRHSAHLLGRWLQVPVGSPVTVAFDAPVELISLRGSAARALSHPRAVVPVGVVARGLAQRRDNRGRRLSSGLGSICRRRCKVSWFPARPYPQLLVEPETNRKACPRRAADPDPLPNRFGTCLVSPRPRVSPATPGHWRLLDAHTLAFQPSGLGFTFGEQVGRRYRSQCTSPANVAPP